MRRKRFKRLVMLLLIGVMLFSQSGFHRDESEAASAGDLIYDVTTDKAMHDPGAKVELRIDLKNRLGRHIVGGSVEIKAKHLQEQVGNTITKTLNLNNNSDLMMIADWNAPESDFTGYLIEVDVKDAAGVIVDSDTVGVDVSSTWTKFPRYGYVWDFRQNTNTMERIDKLKNYHINVLQYYDWKYRHHKPVAPNLAQWNDWSGRMIYGDTVKSYITQARAMGISNMAYNMVYAATSGYEQDGVEQDWALYYADDNPSGKGHFSFKMADSTPTGITHLYFFNPRNPGWQNYIFGEMNKVFQAFDFDGWHGDTVGEWGKMKTSDNQTLYVKDTYTEFLNKAKQAIGDKKLVFNPVGAQGIENVNISNVDALYAEIWPWDRDSDGLLYDTYFSLKKEIEQSRRESGGKSLVVPAYMSYDYGEQNPGSPFNTAAVMLTGATVYAAGGSRMELGDNGNMLSNEYFPAQNLYMTEELKHRISKLYDFIVAYENLLRDGQTETMNRIEFPAYASSPYGDANKIWAYSKKDSQYEIVQMINLLGVSRNDWRANDGQKESPRQISNFEMKYYYSNEITGVWLASPDVHDGRSKPLAFTKGTDGNGNYVKITVPSLEFWNLIYMSTEDSGGETDPPVKEYLVNGDFENGQQGWTFTGTASHGVDSNDAYEGNKYWIYGTEPYTASVSQTVSGLDPGTYTVSAKVKQNTGNPSSSRMKLTGYGGDPFYVLIPHGNAYTTISHTVKVTNGSLKIAFSQTAPGNTNLQIDNVELVPID
ncbi:carbohydrate binding domain-containing protein [Paenibacillus sp. p3-SID867]|uniref:glycoside hydrolase family 66 protein n=1 Tax=Paenibacillus sp. p3-SID867 TaxID=2916363 RepID=UPI0021A2EAAA|nr:glycoside hydrolase family 66 protein [Paenibacillus sp. p3-SID867]MCT1404075.1 carbohydrate binding domain-containing protein [Paenibacillus sp. p3-SID867]